MSRGAMPTTESYGGRTRNGKRMIHLAFYAALKIGFSQYRKVSLDLYRPLQLARVIPDTVQLRGVARFQARGGDLTALPTAFQSHIQSLRRQNQARLTEIYAVPIGTFGKKRARRLEHEAEERGALALLAHRPEQLVRNFISFHATLYNPQPLTRANRTQLIVRLTHSELTFLVGTRIPLSQAPSEPQYQETQLFAGRHAFLQYGWGFRRSKHKRARRIAPFWRRGRCSTSGS